MTTLPAVRGSCVCGRNRYVASLPTNDSSIHIDNSSATRRHQAAPLAAWLRIPLTHFRSATYALFPDETHGSIRRVFDSPWNDDKRIFCGYCGTQLSRWRETPPEEAEFIQLTLGSVVDEDMQRLDELGLLPAEDEEDGDVEEEAEGEVEGLGQRQRGLVRTARDEVVSKGAPWFETMIEDSQLGRVKRRKGGHISRDGTTTVEWEVVEFTSEEPLPGNDSPTKRKRKASEGEGDADGDGDVKMNS